MGPKGPGGGLGIDRAAGELGDEATSVIELSGAIKWFDVSKGYGFIVPDNGMPDILLHVTCLRRDGYQVAYEGARVVVEVLQRPRGLQAFRILSMDEFDCGTSRPDAAAAHPCERGSDQRAGAGAGQMVQSAARLRFPDPGEGTPDVFVHMETLRRYGMTELRPGQYVLVRFGPGPKGLMATEVHPEGGPLGPASH